MIKLTELEKAKLKMLNENLIKTKSKQSYSQCLVYTSYVLKRIYADGYVVMLSLVPELKDCIASLCKYRDESPESFINSIDGLKKEPQDISITTSRQFEYAYINAQKKNFAVKDCLKFYYVCDALGKYCGATPTETTATEMISRINPKNAFDFGNLPSPRNEDLLVYLVQCAQKEINPLSKAFDNTQNPTTLPESYMLHLSKIVAKYESMTVSEWFDKKIVPLSKGIATPLPYMLSTEKSVWEELVQPDSKLKYFRKIVNYISWNNLPKDIIVNALPDFAKKNKFLQAYKTADSVKHKLHKPSCYCNKKLYEKAFNICWSNPNNFIGKKEESFYKAVLNDLRFFVGDTNTLKNPPNEIRPITSRLKKFLKDKQDIVDLLKKYENPAKIAMREQFDNQNSNLTNITIKNPGSNIEAEFVEELKQTYPLGLVPYSLFSQNLGKRAEQIAKAKSTSKTDYIASLGYKFVQSEKDCLMPEDELFGQLKQKYNGTKIKSSSFLRNPLYAQAKTHARLNGQTIKQYFASNGFDYNVEKTSTKASNLTKEQINELLCSSFPTGIIKVSLVTIDFYDQIAKLANKSNLTPLKFVESLGFKCNARKQKKCTRKLIIDSSTEKERAGLIERLNILFPDKVITDKIKGTQIYIDIRAYAREVKQSLMECYKDFGFKCTYVDPKFLKEDELWEIIDKLFPNKVIPKEFENSPHGKKCLRLAAYHGKEIEQYINEHGFAYSKLCNTQANDQEVIKKLWLTFPDGIITDKQFFKTAIGVRIAKMANSKDIDPTDFVEDLGFGFENKTKGIERQ